MNPLHESEGLQTEPGSQPQQTGALQQHGKSRQRTLYFRTICVPRAIAIAGGPYCTGNLLVVENYEPMPIAASKARRTSAGWPYCQRKPVRRALRTGMFSNSLRLTPSMQRARSMFGSSTQLATLELRMMPLGSAPLATAAS